MSARRWDTINTCCICEIHRIQTVEVLLPSYLVIAHFLRCLNHWPPITEHKYWLRVRRDIVTLFLHVLCWTLQCSQYHTFPFHICSGDATSGNPPRCPFAHGSSLSTCQTHFCDAKSLYSFFSPLAQIYFPFFPSFIKGKPELHGKRIHTSRAGRSPGPVILHLHFSHLADALIQSDLQRVQRQTEPECSDVGENMQAEEKRSGFYILSSIEGVGFITFWSLKSFKIFLPIYISYERQKGCIISDNPRFVYATQHLSCHLAPYLTTYFNLSWSHFE